MHGAFQRQLTDWLIHLAALKDRMVRGIVPLLGVMLNASGEQAWTLLGWTAHSGEVAITATVQSLLDLR
jgi:dihydroflavonol-4-reductase